MQYSDLQEEIKDLEKRIYNLEKQIDKIEKEGLVADSVDGGMGGMEHFKIKGFPYPEYSRKKTKLYLYKAQLENAKYELTEMICSVENYIQSIKDSRIRRIIRHRFVDSMSWAQVSVSIGGKCTDESVRKEFERFIIEK
jgi:roadblock/LC7 domain-containing protein